MDEEKVGYGEFISKHRKASGYKSMRTLAEETGINVSTISRIEKEQQVPGVRTLKTLAPYLTTTSLTELMVVCGHWDEDELLEPINFTPEMRETPQPYLTEKEFAEKVELSDDDLLKQFNLEL